MRGSRTGVLSVAALLVLAGIIMLGIGFAMRSANPAAGATSTAPESPVPQPGSTVIPDIENPVAAPATEAEAHDSQVSVPAPASSLDLLPTRVRIPSIEVDTGVIDLGLRPDRTLEVPRDVADTGWYTGRSVPGEIGPSIIVGHVDSAIAGAGVFFNLRLLEPGDLIAIERSDGSVAEFAVTSLALENKDEFPTEQVYGPTEQPTLRLITCGGSFDQGAGSYLGNIIVYARYRGTRQSPLSRS